MNRFKILFMGLMALIMTTLTSCLPGSEDNGSTYAYMTGFFSVSQNGKVLTADDGHTFSVTNPSYLQYKDGSTPSRVVAQLNIEIPEGKTMDDVYNTSYYEVEISFAYSCVTSFFIDPKDAPEQTARFTLFTPSASDGYLNIVMETAMNDTPKSSDFVAFVNKVENNTLYITVRNVADVSKASLYRAGISFPIQSILDMYKNQLTVETSKNGELELKYYKLNVNDTETQYLIPVK